MEDPAQRVIGRFGLVADIQYADTSNGTNFLKTRVRYYRNSLAQLRKAVNDWRSEDVDFVLQLGDVIDGRNNRVPGASRRALEATLVEFGDLTVYHLIGNHELYNFSRREILAGPLNSKRELGISSNSSRLCYDFAPFPGLRVVVIDTFDISVLGVAKDSPEYERAYSKLRAINKNADENDPTGLPPDESMFLGYNGEVSEEQLRWLDQTLTAANGNRENVIVAGHQGVHPDSCDVSAICWNHSAVRGVLTRHSDCVLAYVAGHDHTGGYTEAEGVHYITLPGVIETAPDDSAYGTAELYRDRLKVRGRGLVHNYTLTLKHKLSS